jgi:hypothetical protein
MGKVIGNVGLLDLTTATDEKIKNFARIGNAGAVIYTPSTFKFFSMLDFGNVGASIEVPEGYTLVSTGKFSLDNAFLSSLEPSSLLIFLGKLNIINDISLSLFDEKIKNIIVVGKILIKEEYLEAFNRKITNQTGCKIAVIPAGYSYISEDLSLDSLSITRFNQAKLFIAGRLNIGEDLTEEDLKKHLLKIKVKDIIICSKNIKKAVFNLCDDINTTIYDYTGKMLIVDSHYRLSKSVLKYSADNTTFMVNGELEIDEDILPEDFMGKIEKIYLFGRITCDENQYGFVQSKLAESKGEIFIKGKDEEKDSGDSHNNSEEQSSNFGYLKI